MIRITLLLLCSVITITGCQTPPDIKQLQDQKGDLERQLDQAERKVTSLEASNVQLEQNIAELERVKGILGQEKSSRVAESTHVRGQIRQFIQSQIDNLKQFLLASNLLDYVGGELVKRSNIGDKPTLLLDLYNSVPNNGSLTSVGAYFQSTGTVSVKVLRPVDKNFVVVWASAPVTVSKTGKQRIQFPVSVGVERGDVLAYYFSEPGMVSFDVGTGESRYTGKDISVGGIVKPASMKGAKDKRAYSIGVYGLLNVQ